MRVGPLLGGGGPGPGAIAALTGVADLDRVDLRPAPPALRWIWRRGVVAMTVRNRVYVAPQQLSGDPERLAGLLVHELVHVRQWREVGSRRFLMRYLGDYLRARAAGRPHAEAYQGIRYEVEARRIAGR